LPASVDAKRALIINKNTNLSISRQCELVGLSRSTFYLPAATESAENLRLMRLIDEQYLKTPFYGSRRMTAFLERRGEAVNRKRVQRLMALMGLEGLHPRRRTTIADPAARAYPYLLRDRVLTRPDEVWSSDITYVPMRRGFMYLTAVIDWYSRYVLSWRLSNTMDVGFCLEALEEALSRGRPEIFNTDQGCKRSIKPVLPRRLSCWVGPSSPTQEPAHGTPQRPHPRTCLETTPPASVHQWLVDRRLLCT
jgi:putative transposase